MLHSEYPGKVSQPSFNLCSTLNARWSFFCQVKLGQNQPRFVHFARRYKNKWCNLLRFSQPTNFPGCDDCIAFKDSFEDATETCQSSSE